MADEPAKAYDPKLVEGEIYQRWLDSGAFDARAEGGGAKYCIMIPPPNVTDKLHVGHALNNTLQDILIRFKRMQQFNTLWMPGTDHAGIATQTVVEKRLLAAEGKRRTDFERGEFVARVQAWKDEYEATIIEQLKMMGCSCDWDRKRFTMDAVCAAAVRAAFFKLFADGLIYRGKRLVNWDPATQTVLADDEVEHEEVHGNFWYLRYPLLEPVEISGTAFQAVSPTDILSVEDEDEIVSKRHGAYLPHWTKGGSIYAITFRLADSLPSEVLEGWKREKERILAEAQRQDRRLTTTERKELHRLHSDRVESYLDAGGGICAMNDPRVAEAIENALKHFDGDRYELIAWSVMPNHVHVIVQPLGEHSLGSILHTWKSYSANLANQILGRAGSFWQEEYYDHLIRDEEDFNHCLNYVFANPDKAGLKDWPWRGMKQHDQDGRATHGQDARATMTHVTVATTRPETMLGDTAVAMNPADPRAKALIGKKVRLPIVGRIIPIIADEHVVLPDPDSDDEKARFSTGFLKVTPAHDPDDYEIGQRHGLPMVNVMAPDGTISDRHGWDDATSPEAQNLLGMDRFEARRAVVEFFRAEGLLADVREYVHQVGHSYRSHVPIEPYLSDQWYIAVKKEIPNLPASLKRAGLIEGTDVPWNSLAGLALRPLLEGRLKFTPQRYAKTYQSWLENLRDWPISRQLWWGHRIPVWSPPSYVTPPPEAELDHMLQEIMNLSKDFSDRVSIHLRGTGEVQVPGFYICARDDGEDLEHKLLEIGLQRDPDVLDTWFSSALWPFSTLGWPGETAALKTFYPGDVLCTAREIITLWVSRMVMMGQYCLGDIPFGEVFIHAMIQDGEGRKMSKSLGNGIDPLDIIDSHGADAMRFTLAGMTTQTQDVRMPVEQMTLPDGRVANTSPKFDIGRNFCNKLWNASRFVLTNLDAMPAWGEISPAKELADRWILSRLNAAARDATAALDAYRFNELTDVLYHFMWDDFCDWYLEIAKTRINSGDGSAKPVLAHCLDCLLRLLHPVVPFITEAIWARLSEVAPVRGPGDTPAEALLATAQWPRADARMIDPAAEERFAVIQEIIRQVRNIRLQHNVPASRRLDVLIEAAGPPAELIADNAELLKSQARIGRVSIRSTGAPGHGSPADAAAVTVAGVKLFVLGIIDRDAERARLNKRRQMLERGIGAIEAKLSNESFTRKAPPEVVGRERERLAELRRDMEAVAGALEALK